MDGWTCSLHHHHQVVYAAHNNTLHCDSGCLDSSKTQPFSVFSPQLVQFPTKQMFRTQNCVGLYFCMVIMQKRLACFNLLLNALSSLVQLISRRGLGFLSHQEMLASFLFFHLSLWVHSLFMSPASSPPMLFVLTHGELVTS